MAQKTLTNGQPKRWECPIWTCIRSAFRNLNSGERIAQLGEDSPDRWSPVLSLEQSHQPVSISSTSILQVPYARNWGIGSIKRRELREFSGAITALSPSPRRLWSAQKPSSDHPSSTRRGFILRSSGNTSCPILVGRESRRSLPPSRSLGEFKRYHHL